MKSCNIYATGAAHGENLPDGIRTALRPLNGQDRSLRAFKRYSQRWVRPERPRKELKDYKEFKLLYRVSEV
jgi:hypothetical protein